MSNIINLRRDSCKQAVYVGRGTPFGNPFVVGRDGSREQVVGKYLVWLLAQLSRNPVLRERVRGLRGKQLACWCAPALCHAEILREAAHADNW